MANLQYDPLTNKYSKTEESTELPIPQNSGYAIPDEKQYGTPEENAKLAHLKMDIDMAEQTRKAKERWESKDRTNQILTHRVIDPHESPRLQTVIHKWVNITPSICTEENCGFDAALARGFIQGWDSIPEHMQFDAKRSVRDLVLETLSQHKAFKHQTVGPKHIRTAEEAKKAKQQRQHQIPGGFITNPNLG